MTAPTLFDPPPTEQNRQLKRVSGAIQNLVLDFCRGLCGAREFHAGELRDYVGSRTSAAPGSPDRILRLLRKRGLLRYSVVRRGESLYRVDWVTS